MPVRSSARSPSLALGLALGLLAGLALAVPTRSIARTTEPSSEIRMAFEFRDAELHRVIEAVSVATGVAFIFDATLRGKVNIDVRDRVTMGEALELLEALLRMSGFASVPGPGHHRKIVPLKDAGTSSPWQSLTPGVKREQMVTTLFRLQQARADAVAKTLEGFVPSHGQIIPYTPTNSLILIGTEGNLQRLREIAQVLDDAESREVVVIPLRFRSADVAADLLGQIQAGPNRISAAANIWPDTRTNSLIVRASRDGLVEVLSQVARIDRDVVGEGNLHLRHIRYADAEELAALLQPLLSGVAPQAGSRAAALRSQVAGLQDQVSIAAVPSQNALLVLGTPRSYAVLEQVIDQLDKLPEQVLIEAAVIELIMAWGQQVGFTGLLRVDSNGTDITIQSTTDATTRGRLGEVVDPDSRPISFLTDVEYDFGDTVIRAIVRATQADSDLAVLSQPRLMTVEYEEAEIRIGDNVPILTSRVDAATGTATAGGDPLSTSVNVERQDIGVTLRVTPQITTGDILRLDLFQELTGLNQQLNSLSDTNRVGVSLLNRRIENSVLVPNGATIVTAGIVESIEQGNVNRVPFLGDIPILGWAFKSKADARDRRAIMTFVTATVVNPDGSPRDLAGASGTLSEAELGSLVDPPGPAPEGETAEPQHQERAGLGDL